MNFINPLTDYAFKKIFGSADSGDILLSFLNAILGLESPKQLIEVNIQDSNPAPPEKKTFVDVWAKDEQGKLYIIEIQVLTVPCAEQYLLYNASTAYLRQNPGWAERRVPDDLINLTIANFKMFDHGDVISRFKLRSTTGSECYEDLELNIVELPKFNKPESGLTNMQDKWCYFLRKCADLQTIPAGLAHEQAIRHAFALANCRQLELA